MPRQKASKIIIDTNLWISFLIGKEFQNLKDLIVHGKVKLIVTDQLLLEIKVVTSRAKFKKYFKEENVADLISFLTIVAQKVRVQKIDAICRDPKDDFLLALAKAGKEDYLITGDKDLLEIKNYGQTKILSYNRFMDDLR